MKQSSAESVQAAIEKLWKPPAFSWLKEVSNGTGARARRWADAVAVSIWPSRGLYAMGIEIKVHRSDWLRELEQPSKSDPVQKYCRHWWVATPPGIVAAGELPATWGLVEVAGGKAKVIVDAPELTPEPLTWEFTCAILRRASESQHAIETMAAHKAHESAREEFNAEAVEQMRLELHQANRALDIAKRDVETMTTKLKTLRGEIGAIGVDSDFYGRIPPGTREAVQFAKQIQHLDVVGIGERLKAAFEAHQALVEAVRETAAWF